MKQKRSILIVVAIGLVLAAGFLLPPIPASKSRHHGKRIPSVNHLDSVNFAISSNEMAGGQSQPR